MAPALLWAVSKAADGKLVYDETPSEMTQNAAEMSHCVAAASAIGLELRDDGDIDDTVEGSLAAKAGIGPGHEGCRCQWPAVFREILHDAIQAAKNSSAPIELLVENTDYYKTYKIDYHGGESYPHLVRDESKPDLLSDILKAK